MRKFVDLYEEYMGHLDGKTVIKVLQEERARMFSRDKETVEWLGSNLQGVHDIIYRKEDINMLMYKLGINSVNLYEDTLKTKGFKKEWRTSSNPYNVTIMMCALKIMDSNMKEYDKNKGLEHAFLLFFFRTITSKYQTFFPADIRDINRAREAYDLMNENFEIRKHGSNYGVMVSKVSLFQTNSSNIKRIMSKKGSDVVYTINNLANIVTGYVKRMANVFYEKTGERKSLSVMDDDGVHLSLESNNDVYINELLSKMLRPREVIDNNLLFIINEVSPNVPLKSMKELVVQLSLEHIHGNEDMKDLFNSIITGSNNYLYKENFYPPYDKSLPTLIKYLKAFWSGSKVKDKDILHAKDIIKKYTKKHLEIRKEANINKLAIVIGIYMFLLAVMGVMKSKKS